MGVDRLGVDVRKQACIWGLVRVLGAGGSLWAGEGGVPSWARGWKEESGMNGHGG